MSSFDEIFVNDAFSCSRRKHLPDKITKFLPSYCGISNELTGKCIQKVTSDIQKPMACIMSGSKFQLKLVLFKIYYQKFEKIHVIVRLWLTTLLNIKVLM